MTSFETLIAQGSNLTFEVKGPQSATPQPKCTVHVSSEIGHFRWHRKWPTPLFLQAAFFVPHLQFILKAPEFRFISFVFFRSLLFSFQCN